MTTETTTSRVVFRHIEVGGLIAGGLLIALGTFALWWYNRENPAPLFNISLPEIIPIGFIGIGLMGLWDARRTKLTVSGDNVSIKRIRLVTNQKVYERDVPRVDIKYIHFAYSFTRGGGFWFILQDGSRIELLSMISTPIPFTLLIGRYLRGRARRLSQALNINLV